MIDYNQLKIVHELCPNGRLKIIPIFDSEGNLESFNYSMEIEGVMANYFFSIDDLIAKLQELTQPKPKYEVGQHVWFIGCTRTQGPVCVGIVKENQLVPSKWNEEEYYVSIGEGLKIPEKCAYPTRGSLIDAQIEYWQKMKDGIAPCRQSEEASTGSDYASTECEHEYTFTSGFACAKCGENKHKETHANPNGDCMGVKVC